MKMDIKLLITVVICSVIVSTALHFFLYAEPKRYPVIQNSPSPTTVSTNALPEITTPTLPSSELPITSVKSSPLHEITSLDEVFTPQIDSDPEDSRITLMATGDVLLARSINYKMRQLNDFSWPFLQIAPLLQSADITYINLETPLVQDCPSKIDGMIFCGDQRGVESLEYAGIDVVNIANNHAANYGLNGVTETDAVLKTHNFVVSGKSGSNVGYKTVKGTRFAFLGYNEVNQQLGISLALDPTIQAEVREARTQADVVVVQFHWGNEYTYNPSENQRRLARVAIDAGADLVIGNHPHWYQPIEFYNGKLITYSHGNLVFDQMWSRETREGLIGEYTFSRNKLVGVHFIPILIENYGQPRVLEGVEKEKILENLQEQSYLIKEM